MKWLNIFIVLLLSCSENEYSLPYYISQDLTPVWSKTNSSVLHKIKNFRFINQYGQYVTEETFKGKIFVANFFFTTCNGICPKMTTNMVQIQKAFESDKSIMLLSHSVTPEIDTVTVLKTFADKNAAMKSKWHFITGRRNDIYSQARNSYFADEDLGENKNTNDFLHTENFYLIDKKRHIRGVYNGVLPADIERLIEDIKTLKKENP